MKRKNQARAGTVLCMTCVLFLASMARTQQSPAQFTLTPLDISTVTGQTKMNLMMGAGILCETTPNQAVKVQAKTKSRAALHGELSVGGNPLNPSEGKPVYFTLDQSQGKTSGYDTLIIDLNGDLDLTNDAPLSVDDSFSKEDLPPLGSNRIAFAPFTLKRDDCTETLRSILIPLSDTQTIAMFIPTMARQGRVKIGDKEHDIILAQTNVITGRYDHVWTACFLDGQRNGDTGLLSDWPTVDGTLYELTSNKQGTRLTVQPYAGRFGTLNVTSNTGKKVAVDREGYLMSRTKLINLANCRKKDGKLQIPEDDYMPVSLMLNLDTVKLALRFSPSPDQTDLDPYRVRIRGNETSLKAPTFKDVAFTWTKPDKTFHPGENVSISASLCDKATGLAVAGIAQKTGQSIVPMATIMGPDGKVVAEGKMPFG